MLLTFMMAVQVTDAIKELAHIFAEKVVKMHYII